MSNNYSEFDQKQKTIFIRLLITPPPFQIIYEMSTFVNLRQKNKM